MYGIGTTELIIILPFVIIVIFAIVFIKRSSQKGSSGLKMAWFNFYTYIRLPIAILITLGAMINVSSTANLVILILYILLMILIIWGHTKRKLVGWYLNLILIGFETILYPLSYIKESIAQVVILFLIIAVLWFLPNFIYFKKRIQLFS